MLQNRATLAVRLDPSANPQVRVLMEQQICHTVHPSGVSPSLLARESQPKSLLRCPKTVFGNWSSVPQAHSGRNLPQGICRTEVTRWFGGQGLARDRRRRYRHKQNKAPRPFGSQDLRAGQRNRHAGKKRERPHGSEVMSNVEVCATYWGSALAATHNMDAMAVNFPTNVHGICLRDLLHEIIVCTTA